jgi:DNA-binding response OmpR family regulator
MTAAQNARRWAEEIGADGYLAKPFDLLDLLNAVERLGGRSSS